MKFKELKEKMGKMSGSKLTGQELSVYYRENPLAKKAARDPMLKKAIEFALDHGGAMNYAIKNIEKMKRGISRHPQVQQALQFANESNNVQALKDAINEKMSPAEKKKRLDMIRKAVEKLNAKADAQAKKDALAAIKAMESVSEAMLALSPKQYDVFKKAGIETLMKKHDAYVSDKNPRGITISSPNPKFFDLVTKLSKKPAIKRQLKGLKEGIDTREKNLNYKIKELEYKMKLKDFMKDMVDAKLPKKKEKKEEAVESLKVNDTSSDAFNKLSKLARDIGVELSREENHLLVKGDAKKMAEFKGQMKVAMKESVLNEAYSRRFTDKDVDKEFKSFGNEKNQKEFFGDLDKARAEMKLNDYHPGNSARPKVWTALRYPVRDGDYYFAFIDKNERKNMKYNEQLNDALKRAKVGGDKKSVDDMWLIASNELRTYPKSLGWNDTMTREEIYGAIQHLLGKISESNIIEKHIKTKAGIMVGKRMKAPRYESVKESTTKTLAQIRENADFRKLVSKYKNEAKKLQRLGQAFPEPGSRFYDDLASYIYDNEPSIGDDPDDVEAEMENLIDDLSRGRR